MNLELFTNVDLPEKVRLAAFSQAMAASRSHEENLYLVEKALITAGQSYLKNTGFSAAVVLLILQRFPTQPDAITLLEMCKRMPRKEDSYFHVVPPEEYTTLLEQNHYHLEKIKEIATRNNELLEGNCFYMHNTWRQVPLLMYKQLNLFSLARGRRRILEIGFNAGHSCLVRDC
ncbi:hypothetical protein CCP3SC1AL1_500014 [Gammaproteobacteria bacterium]